MTALNFSLFVPVYCLLQTNCLHWLFATVGHLPLAGVSMGIRLLPGSGWVNERSFLFFNKKRSRPVGLDLFNLHLCARGDLNPHARRHRNLNPACLPIPPLALGRCRRCISGLPGDPARALKRTTADASFHCSLGAQGFGVSPFPAGFRQSSRLRSRRSLATWPVARTLYWASTTFPPASTTMVERMSPW